MKEYVFKTSKFFNESDNRMIFLQESRLCPILIQKSNLTLANLTSTRNYFEY